MYRYVAQILGNRGGYGLDPCARVITPPHSRCHTFISFFYWYITPPRPDLRTSIHEKATHAKRPDKHHTPSLAKCAPDRSLLKQASTEPLKRHTTRAIVFLLTPGLKSVSRRLAYICVPQLMRRLTTDYISSPFFKFHRFRRNFVPSLASMGAH